MDIDLTERLAEVKAERDRLRAALEVAEYWLIQPRPQTEAEWLAVREMRQLIREALGKGG